MCQVHSDDLVPMTILRPEQYEYIMFAVCQAGVVRVVNADAEVRMYISAFVFPHLWGGR